MKIFKLIGALLLSLALLGGGQTGVRAQENDLVSEDDAYDSTFSGPLIYCRRADTALALADDAQTMPILCDNEGKLYTTAAGGSGGAVTNAGVFAVQEDGAALTAQQAIQTAVELIDDSVAAEGAALGSGVLLQGDDGTNRKNVNVDPSTGDVQVDVTNTVTVDLAGNNDVVLTAGLLHADSPTTEVAVLLMIDGSADADIVTTNLSKSSAITVTGSGRITKLCLIVEGTSPFSEDGTIYFFDTDPAISSNTADMTVAEAITVTSMISLKGTDYNDNFATIKINCQATDESFHAITHVVYEQEGSTTIANQDFRLHVWYRRNS